MMIDCWARNKLPPFLFIDTFQCLPFTVFQSALRSDINNEMYRYLDKKVVIHVAYLQTWLNVIGLNSNPRAFK